jgi:hypothetical protein
MKGNDLYGIYENMSNNEYHAAPGISATGLKLFARSPLHYWAAYLDPNREPREETPALRLGTAIHTAVLEPERFTEEYVTVPADAPRRPTSAQLNAKNPSDDTVAAIEWWKAFDEANAAKTVISADDFSTCDAISQRLRAHPAAQVLFKSGVAEQSFFWTDADTGVVCKCRPDWLILGTAIVDLKSTTDASATGFSRAVYNYEYHLQAAWYLDGIRSCVTDAPSAFIFAAFEKDAPHAVAFYNADPDMIELGRREYRRRLSIYAECLKSNTWPGYPASITNLSLPAWVLKAANDNNPGENK